MLFVFIYIVFSLNLFECIFSLKLTTLCLIRHHHVKFLCFLHQFSFENQYNFVCSLVKLEEKYIRVISKVQKVIFYSYNISKMIYLVRYEYRYFDTYNSLPFWYELECCRCNFFRQIKVQITALRHMVMITALEAVIIFQSFLA